MAWVRSRVLGRLGSKTACELACQSTHSGLHSASSIRWASTQCCTHLSAYTSNGMKTWHPENWKYISTSQHHQWRTEPRPLATCTKKGWSRLHGFQVMQVDRQTDKCTNRLITILHNPNGQSIALEITNWETNYWFYWFFCPASYLVIYSAAVCAFRRW